MKVTTLVAISIVPVLACAESWLNGVEQLGQNSTYEASTNALNTDVIALESATNDLSSQTATLRTATNDLSSQASTLRTATNAIQSEKVAKSGDTMSGALYSSEATSYAGNTPATNQFATAGWVRSILGAEQLRYNSTNLVDVQWTTGVERCYQMLPVNDTVNSTRVLGITGANQYVSSIITTQRYNGLSGPVLVNAYMRRDGVGGASLSIKPEIYYTYSTNGPLLGDWEAGGQFLNTTTTLYTWAVPVPETLSTNDAGFYIVRRFKVVSQVSNPNLYLSIGGLSAASFIQFNQPANASGASDPALYAATNALNSRVVITTQIVYTADSTVGAQYTAANYTFDRSAAYVPMSFTAAVPAGAIAMAAMLTANSTSALKVAVLADMHTNLAIGARVWLANNTSSANGIVNLDENRNALWFSNCQGSPTGEIIRINGWWIPSITTNKW